MGILLTTKLTAFIADVCHIRCLASGTKTLLVFSVPLMQRVEPNTIYFNNDSRPDLTVFKHRSWDPFRLQPLGSFTFHRSTHLTPAAGESSLPLYCERASPGRSGCANFIFLYHERCLREKHRYWWPPGLIHAGIIMISAREEHGWRGFSKQRWCLGALNNVLDIARKSSVCSHSPMFYSHCWCRHWRAVSHQSTNE